MAIDEKTNNESSKITLYWLYHRRDLGDGYRESKNLGVFSSEKLAQEFIKRVLKQPGFRDYLDGFEINKFILDEGGWEDGFQKNGT
jgi:hypothetical protein